MTAALENAFLPGELETPAAAVSGQKSEVSQEPMPMPLARALKIGTYLLNALEPFCHKIELAGSPRRRRPFCNDIDLVCIPRDMAAFRARVLQRCALKVKEEVAQASSLRIHDPSQAGSLRHTPVADGGQNLLVIMPNGVQLDFFFAHQGRPELFESAPPNWGSVLVCRTGSVHHNIWLCQVAGRLGMHWDPPNGLKKDGKIIASESEVGIFRALGLPFIEPEKRER